MPLRGAKLMRAMFHAPSSRYRLLKEKGFNAVEISLNAWPGDYANMHAAMKEAHDLGLKCIVDIGIKNDHVAAFKFLQEANWREGDIVSLPDEVNAGKNKMTPLSAASLSNIIKTYKPNLKTLATLDGNESFQNYSGCADILAVDWYGKMTDLWRVIPLTFRLKQLKRNHKGEGREIWGIPGIKNSDSHIRWQRKWWTGVIGVTGLYWYSWAGDGGKWGFNDLSEDKPDWLEAMR